MLNKAVYRAQYWFLRYINVSWETLFSSTPPVHRICLYTQLLILLWEFLKSLHACFWPYEVFNIVITHWSGIVDGVISLFYLDSYIKKCVCATLSTWYIYSNGKSSNLACLLIKIWIHKMYVHICKSVLSCMIELFPLFG